MLVPTVPWPVLGLTTELQRPMLGPMRELPWPMLGLMMQLLGTMLDLAPELLWPLDLMTAILRPLQVLHPPRQNPLQRRLPMLPRKQHRPSHLGPRPLHSKCRYS